MTDESNPHAPGPPREVQEDATAREPSMTAGRLAGRAIMLWRKTCCVEEIPCIDILEGHVEAAIRDHAEQARAEERAAKDFAYSERNQLVALLARLFPSGVARTDIPGWDAEWHGCVYIDLPTGQASWHFHDSEAHLFDGLPPYEGVWDGHTTKEKYRRLIKLIEPDIRQRSEPPND